MSNFSLESDGTGADFYKAMVATAQGEKLLIGRRSVRNWTQLHFFCFVSL